MNLTGRSRGGEGGLSAGWQKGLVQPRGCCSFILVSLCFQLAARAGILPQLTQLHSLQSKWRHCEAKAVFHRRRGCFLVLNATALPGIRPWLCTCVYRRLVLVGWTALTTTCNLCCPLTPSCASEAVLEICSFNYCLLVFYLLFFLQP